MFANRLIKLRVEKNLTQAELGKFLNLGTSTIGMYETEQRKPDIDKLISICCFFEVSADYILGLSNKRTSAPSPLTLEQKELNELFLKLDAINQGAVLERTRMLYELQQSKANELSRKKEA